MFIDLLHIWTFKTPNKKEVSLAFYFLSFCYLILQFKSNFTISHNITIFNC